MSIEAPKTSIIDKLKKMPTWQKLAIGGSIGLVGITALALAIKGASANDGGGDVNGGDGTNFTLITQAGSHGNINPYTTGTPKPKGTVVTIDATPDEGYEVYEWRVDAAAYAGRGQNQITVTMNRSHTVYVQFTLVGQDPIEVGFADAIAPFANPTTPATTMKVYGYYGAQISTSPGAWGQQQINAIKVDYTDSNWNFNQVAEYWIGFKVTDSSGHPVPGVDVDIWTDPMPDVSKYQGYMIIDKLGPGASTKKTTDADGMVYVSLSYFTGLTSDGYLNLCKDADLKFRIGIDWYWPYDGATEVNGKYLNEYNGDSYTQQPGANTALAVYPLISNLIHAKISGTTRETAATINCGFHLKMLQPSTTTPKATLTLQVVGNGITDPAEGNTQYDVGSTVTLTAIDGNFSKWENRYGSTLSYNTTYTFTITGDTTIIAVFS